MHTLHTTPAYVMEAYPHGESNRVYKLFTRELGLLYAHAQSVRELKSRNKYALQVGCKITVTLVRGREVWRVTSAQPFSENGLDTNNPVPRKLLHLVGKLIAVEDEMKEVFDALATGTVTMATVEADDAVLIEAITVLRIMNKLGFVARPVEEECIAFFLDTDDYTDHHMEQAREKKELLLMRVNTALEEAK